MTKSTYIYPSFCRTHKYVECFLENIQKINLSVIMKVLGKYILMLFGSTEVIWSDEIKSENRTNYKRKTINFIIEDYIFS